jgi:hypothetical protein
VRLDDLNAWVGSLKARSKVLARSKTTHQEYGLCLYQKMKIRIGWRWNAP